MRKSYRVYAEAVGVGDGEGVVFVCDEQHVWHGVDPQGVVVGPVHGADVQRQRRQVRLRQDRLHKLQDNSALEPFSQGKLIPADANVNKEALNLLRISL